VFSSDWQNGRGLFPKLGRLFINWWCWMSQRSGDQLQPGSEAVNVRFHYRFQIRFSLLIGRPTQLATLILIHAPPAPWFAAAACSLGQPAQPDGAFHGFAGVVMLLPRPGQQTFHPDAGFHFGQ
jgi:hypothetical protein